MSTTKDTIRARRVAIVTYYFPPLGGVGVQRILKHATYLTRYGWEPVIFTPRNPVYEITDPDLASTVPPGLEVHRSFIFEPSRLYRWATRLVRSLRHPRFASRGGRHANGESGRAAGINRVEEPLTPADDRLRRLLATIGHLAFFPDEQVAWIPFAIRSIRGAARQRRFDAVVSSSPPITAHLVAGLARRAGTPWIADFRDPWIGNAFAPDLPWFHRQLRIRIEDWIVRRADLSLFSTPSLRSAYASRYPDLAHGFVALPNGYDRRDLPDPVGARPDASQFLMVYAGSLYGEHELEVFLEGLRRVLHRRPEFRDRLRVEFLGWLSRNNRVIADRASRSEILAGVVSFRGFRPRDEALRRIAAADAGLLIVGDEPGKGLVVPVKLYEYIGLDRQVLAVVPAGDVEDLLHGLDWGVVVRPEPDAIADGIERVMTESRPDRIADPEGRYDRAALAAELATLLDEATKARS